MVFSWFASFFSFLPAFLYRGFHHRLLTVSSWGAVFGSSVSSSFFSFFRALFFHFHLFSCVSGWVVFHTDYYRENGALGVEC